MKERWDADEQDSPGHRWVRLTPMRPPGTAGVRPHAVDPQIAERLWTLSERLTGVRFEEGGVREGGTGEKGRTLIVQTSRKKIYELPQDEQHLF